MRLFCFPYAGGTAEFFNKLEQNLQSHVNVNRLEYAGHGTRRKERPYQDFSELADDMYALLKSQYVQGESYGLFGYSMGSIAAVEVLKRILQAQEMDDPVHIFLGAHGPEMKRELKDDSDWGTDSWIKRRTVEFGGIPPKLQDNQAFWRVYLPQYRADYSLIKGYPFKELNLSCQIPATIFYSETDTPFQEIEKWRRVFSQCEFLEYRGTHFFLIEHWQEAAEIIKSRMGGRAQISAALEEEEVRPT